MVPGATLLGARASPWLPQVRVPRGQAWPLQPRGLSCIRAALSCTHPRVPPSLCQVAMLGPGPCRPCWRGLVLWEIQWGFCVGPTVHLGACPLDGPCCCCEACGSSTRLDATALVWGGHLCWRCPGSTQHVHGLQALNCRRPRSGEEGTVKAQGCQA